MKGRSASFLLVLIYFSILSSGIPLAVMAQEVKTLALDDLTDGKTANRFRAEALYLNDADKPFGARFRHERTGFTLDFLELQSVPQALMWVNSFPTSDRGEPHTQEHLLLGKGNAGRTHSSLEDMSLAGSTAFTMQWRTVYQLHTAAGPEVFYKLFESQADSLLHPDYTDEEIRREVSHWGINDSDWDYLARQIRHDLLSQPAQVLANLNVLRQSLLKTGGARLFFIGSPASRSGLEPGVGALLAGLEQKALQPAKYATTRLVETRLRGRDNEKGSPIYVGLTNPNTQGGVFLNSAPSVSYLEADNREMILDYLASRLFAGGGAHGIFIKTWGAGLAYSNGFRGSPATGRMGYYAERTPELPQTLCFVIDEIKKAKPDPGLIEYAIAGAFGAFRSASPYEVRGESMAADIADGLTPDVIRRFRQAILALRRDPKLADELFKRMGRVYARILPGLGVNARDVEGGIFFVIGPEKQLTAYEEYLKTVEGPIVQLYRIYPRDYWMPLKV